MGIECRLRHFLVTAELLVDVLVDIFEHISMHNAAIYHFLGHGDSLEFRIWRNQRDR